MKKIIFSIIILTNSIITSTAIATDTVITFYTRKKILTQKYIKEYKRVLKIIQKELKERTGKLVPIKYKNKDLCKQWTYLIPCYKYKYGKEYPKLRYIILLDYHFTLPIKKTFSIIKIRIWDIKTKKVIKANRIQFIRLKNKIGKKLLTYQQAIKLYIKNSIKKFYPHYGRIKWLNLPNGAKLYINKKIFNTQKGNVPVPSLKNIKIKVEKKGFKTFQTKLKLKDNQTITLLIPTLKPGEKRKIRIIKPPQKIPKKHIKQKNILTKWWFWAAIGGITTGIAITATTLMLIKKKQRFNNNTLEIQVP